MQGATSATSWVINPRPTKRRHRKAMLAGLLVGILTASVVGYALWMVGGSGSAYTKATSSVDLTTNDVTATVAESLYPGGDGTVEVSFHNENPFDVEVTQVNFGAVTPSGFFVTVDANTGPPGSLSIIVPAGGDSGPQELGAVAHMGAAAGDGAQGQVFTIEVTSIVAQQVS